MKKKRGRGRPKTLEPLFNIPTRFTRATIDKIDDCKLHLRAELGNPKITRGRAIRYLMELGLESLNGSLNKQS